MNLLFRKNKIWMILFILPVLLLFTTVIIIPLIQSAYFSFCKWDGLNVDSFVGFENYQKMFSAREFPISIINSLLYALILVVYQVGLSLLLL